MFLNNPATGLPSTLTADGSGNLTFTARWIQSTNGVASAPPMALTGTWFSGGTSTTTKPQFLIEPAGTPSNNWPTAGTGLGVNAPSGFTGDLAWFGVNGTTQFAVSASGVVSRAHQFNLPHQAGQNSIQISLGGGANGVFLGSTLELAWSEASNNVFSGTKDLRLLRDAANTLAQRNGTNAQRSRIYNTFTSDTNFERLNIRWTSNEAIIDTEAGSGGGTLRGLRIGSAATSLLGFYTATPVAQPAAVADATDAASVITQLNLALARLRTLGLITT